MNSLVLKITSLNKQKFCHKNNIFEIVKVLKDVKILIVSATEKEIKPLIDSLIASSGQSGKDGFVFKSLTIDILVTGIGMVFTTFFLTQKLSNEKYDLVINAGIAGSFSELLSIGDVVQVVEDQFADLGIEDEESFSTIFEKGFVNLSDFPFINGKLKNKTIFIVTEMQALKKATAITVNITHGNSKTIELFKEKFGAELETMEGAAFFYVSLFYEVNFIQLRAISNYVKPRKFAQWNISLAIENLNKKLFELLIVLDNKQEF